MSNAPFFTQVEYDPRLGYEQGFKNCGPVTVAMALMALGYIPKTREAINDVADLARDGDLDDGRDSSHTGSNTDFAQLQRAARHYGAVTTLVTSWEEVQAALDADKLVGVLMHGELLQPRAWPDGWMHYPQDGHFVLACSRDGLGNVQVNDPLAYPVEWTCVYTEDSLRRASAGFSPLAMVFEPPPAVDVPVEAPSEPPPAATEEPPAEAPASEEPGDPKDVLIAALTAQVGEISADRDRYAAAQHLSDCEKFELERFARDLHYHRAVIRDARHAGVNPVDLLIARGQAAAG